LHNVEPRRARATGIAKSRFRTELQPLEAKTPEAYAPGLDGKLHFLTFRHDIGIAGNNLDEFAIRPNVPYALSDKCRTTKKRAKTVSRKQNPTEPSDALAAASTGHPRGPVEQIWVYPDHGFVYHRFRRLCRIGLSAHCGTIIDARTQVSVYTQNFELHGPTTPTLAQHYAT
jgi:hypothetical protein